VLRVQPGYAFSIVCDLGFAVGLTTHVTKRMGSFVWIAQPMFDEEPTAADAASVRAWRWPTWLPLGPMAHRKLVIPLGMVPIPEELREYPVMRSGMGHQWSRIAISEDGTGVRASGVVDPSMPINQAVNDTRLREMLVLGWKPEDEW
jgi:hypothetical protein